MHIHIEKYSSLRPPITRIRIFFFTKILQLLELAVLSFKLSKYLSSKNFKISSLQQKRNLKSNTPYTV